MQEIANLKGGRAGRRRRVGLGVRARDSPRRHEGLGSGRAGGRASWSPLRPAAVGPEPYIASAELVSQMPRSSANISLLYWASPAVPQTHRQAKEFTRRPIVRPGHRELRKLA